MFLCVDIKRNKLNWSRKVFRFGFKPVGGFDLFVTGRSHFLLSECSLSFNNAMITLTRARWSARIVELASGSRLLISSLPGSALKTHVEWLGKPRDVNKRSQSLAWKT